MTTTSRLASRVLVALSALLALAHLTAIPTEENTLAFGALAALDAMTAVVVWVGCRDGLRWAWAAGWFQVAAVALVAAVGDPTQPDIGAALQITYGVIAVVLAAALLAARPAPRS